MTSLAIAFLQFTCCSSLVTVPSISSDMAATNPCFVRKQNGTVKAALVGDVTMLLAAWRRARTAAGPATGR